MICCDKHMGRNVTSSALELMATAALVRVGVCKVMCLLSKCTGEMQTRKHHPAV